MMRGTFASSSTSWEPKGSGPLGQAARVADHVFQDSFPLHTGVFLAGYLQKPLVFDHVPLLWAKVWPEIFTMLWDL